MICIHTEIQVYWAYNIECMDENPLRYFARNFKARPMNRLTEYIFFKKTVNAVHHKRATLNVFVLLRFSFVILNILLFIL